METRKQVSSEKFFIFKPKQISVAASQKSPRVRWDRAKVNDQRWRRESTNKIRSDDIKLKEMNGGASTFVRCN